MCANIFYKLLTGDVIGGCIGGGAGINGDIAGAATDNFISISVLSIWKNTVIEYFLKYINISKKKVSYALKVVVEVP